MGAILVAAGLMLVFLFFIQAATQGSASYGGVILIGPIPVVFGSSPQMALVSMFLGLALTVLSFLLFWRRLPEKRTREEGNGEGDNKEDSRGDGIGEESASMIKGGAVVMIGPIPLVVGSDSRTALIMMLIALAMIILWTLAIKGG